MANPTKPSSRTTQPTAPPLRPRRLAPPGEWNGPVLLLLLLPTTQGERNSTLVGFGLSAATGFSRSSDLMATCIVASIMSIGRLATALCSAILGALHKLSALPHIEEEHVGVLPSMVEAELPHLPEDLLVQILSRLEIPDLLRASSVCSSWHSAYTTLHSLGQYKRHQTPCLFYTSESAGKNVGCIYSLAEQRTYKITLPDPPIRDRYLIGSSDGWLVTIDDKCEMHLLNPVTREQMALPPVITMEQVNPTYDESGAIVKYENRSQFWHDGVMFSSRSMGSIISPRWQQLFLTGRAFVFSETSTGKLLVVLIRNPFGQLSFARVGDDEWDYLPEYGRYEDCTYKDGLLYAVTTLGEIHAIDLSGPIAMVKVVMGKVMDIGDGDRNTYILHAPWGDVLQIWKTEEDDYIHPSEDDYDAILKNTASIEVYKSDLVEEKLVKINRLQDHVLFVGHNQTLCLRAEEFPSLKANHAYFTDDSQNWITEFKNNRRDIGVFNLEDNSRDELGSPQLWSNWPSPSNANLRTREWQHGGNPPSCGVADQGSVSGSHQKKGLGVYVMRLRTKKGFLSSHWQPNRQQLTEFRFFHSSLQQSMETGIRLRNSPKFRANGDCHNRKRRKLKMSDPKYAYPYPAQGYYQGPYQGPPVMAPPQYAAPPPRRQPSFLEGCLAALCCCCLIDECCCDPSIIFVS
ncbi:putative F-box protein At5g55150 [Oryza sativa Japonica Group]|uniref:F-box domain containing protein, expressed n=1 Tax=Oryza sativa subsp. japonica TaxID=39947 RepID=Q10BX1_ORYSJ|nr:F-box domain containing protein, expressed [Oryza sativa Japonica Group]USI00196.1 F-box and DUF domain-containing protein [Oryza sativa Japonica Group]